VDIDSYDEAAREARLNGGDGELECAVTRLFDLVSKVVGSRAPESIVWEALIGGA